MVFERTTGSLGLGLGLSLDLGFGFRMCVPYIPYGADEKSLEEYYHRVMLGRPGAHVFACTIDSFFLNDIKYIASCFIRFIDTRLVYKCTQLKMLLVKKPNYLLMSVTPTEGYLTHGIDKFRVGDAMAFRIKDRQLVDFMDNCRQYISHHTLL